MSLIERTDHGAVTTLTFNRPEKLNSFNGEMLTELDTELRAAHDRPETRVIVLAGSGRAFSTGADLNEYAGRGPLEARRANEDTWMRLFRTIEALDEPVIASVNGYALAGGTELLLACDLVVASETATFGLTESRVGVIPGAGACIRLTRWVGRAAAKEILMTGDPFSAQDAHRLGLVNRLAPAEQLEAVTQELAQTLASRSPLALAAAKRAVNIGAEMDSERGMQYVLQEFALLFAGRDQEEGMRAFLEKRPPEFTGT